MTPNEKILVGRITKLYGFDGAVTVKLEKDFPALSDETELVFLETEGRPVPFFIEYTETVVSGFIRMKFAGFDTVESMQEFVGCRVLSVPREGSHKSADDGMRELVGFDVYSENKCLGRIKDIKENPGQILLEITSKTGKELLIPLHEDFITGIDKVHRIIRMILPEGLTEIN